MHHISSQGSLIQCIFDTIDRVACVQVHPEPRGGAELAGETHGGVCRDSPLPMNDLNPFWTRVAPPEADTPLIVDSDTVLPRTITAQTLEAVTRRESGGLPDGTQHQSGVTCAARCRRFRGYYPSPPPEPTLRSSRPRTSSHFCDAASTNDT